jgi:EAL domain-containing protein (putative c-di-GMP-specific phosphodiesterase class I)
MRSGHEAVDRGSDVQRALDCGEIVRAYQAIVDLGTGAPSFVEALLRWQHPNDGELVPRQFLPEDDALLVRIGWSVVIEGARRAGEWRRRFPAVPIAVSVNVASAHLAERDLSSRIEHLLRDNDVDGRGGFAVELGQRHLLADRRRVADRIEALRNLGVDIVVDDFGANDSLEDALALLESLQRFPLDVIKLHPDFVARVATGPGQPDGVARVVARAHDAGLRVVATAVESNADATRARARGFDLGQGFLFHRPGPPEAIDALLSDAAPAIASAP